MPLHSSEERQAEPTSLLECAATASADTGAHDHCGRQELKTDD
jgi:hypothetical protein